MTVTHVTPRNDYTGNGVASVYGFTFPLLGPDDLAVYETDTSGNITRLQRGVHYTVDINIADRTGTVTRTAGPLTFGYRWALVREMERTQPTQLSLSQIYTPRTQELSLDRLAMQVQDLGEELRHAVRFPQATVSGSEMPLGVPLRASKVLGTDPAGNFRTYDLADLGGSSGGGGTSSSYGYNVMDDEFGASGSGLSTPLTAEEAADFNARFAAYGAQGAYAIVAGDERDFAAIQCCMWKAAHTGRSIHVPAGKYIANKPLRLDWIASPPNSAQPAKPLLSVISGEGRNTIICGMNTPSGRAVIELIGTANYYHAVDMLLEKLTFEQDASCSNASYCVRAGDAWCGLKIERVNCHGANGVLLKVADSSSYAQLCTQLSQVNVWTNWQNRWFASESDASLYAMRDETGGALWDNVSCYECVFRGQVVTRAWICNFYGCQFATPSQRPAGFNGNIRLNIGSLLCVGCYFEDHKEAIVAGASLGPIATVILTSCHFSGVQNFGGPAAGYAINCFTSTFQLGHLSAFGCRFNTSGYTPSAINAVGCAYTIEGCTDLYDPGTPVSIDGDFGRGVVRQIDISKPYDVLTVQNVRYRIPIFDGGSVFEDDINGPTIVSARNLNTGSSAYVLNRLVGDGFNGEIAVFPNTFAASSVRKTLAIFTDQPGTAVTLGANGVEAMRVSGYSGGVRVQFGNPTDDGANICQFNSSIRKEGEACSFALLASNVTINRNTTRVEFSAACTATLPLGNSWGTGISGIIEIHNRHSSSGAVSLAASGSDAFDAFFAPPVAIFPGETIFVRSNGGSPALWTLARSIPFRPSYTRFSATTSATFSNSTAETAITPSGVGDVSVPLGTLQPGRTIRGRAFGQCDVVGTPTFRLRIKYGSTVILDRTTPALAAMTAGGWSLDFEITCRTNGVSGTVFGQGMLTINGVAYHIIGSSVTYNTTVANSLQLTGQWSVANLSNSWTTTNFRMIEEN